MDLDSATVLDAQGKVRLGSGMVDKVRVDVVTVGMETDCDNSNPCRGLGMERLIIWLSCTIR